MKYSYRIESVHVPAAAGTAGEDDKAADLGGRRIVHVLEQRPGGSHLQGITLTVLTEQAAEPG